MIFNLVVSNDATDTETMIYTTLVFPEAYITPSGQMVAYTRWLQDQDFTENLETASPSVAAEPEHGWQFDPPAEHEDEPRHWPRTLSD